MLALRPQSTMGSVPGRDIFGVVCMVVWLICAAIFAAFDLIQQAQGAPIQPTLRTLKYVPPAVRGTWCYWSYDEAKGEVSYKKGDCNPEPTDDSWVKIGPLVWKTNEHNCRVGRVIEAVGMGGVWNLTLECRGEDQEFHKYVWVYIGGYDKDELRVKEVTSITICHPQLWPPVRAA